MNCKKKLLCFIIISIMSCVFGACSGTEKETGKINVVCISFPEYDWARQVIGEKNDKVNLTLIVDNGMDIHNYQPSAEDMIEIADRDLLIYNGGQSESWVEEAVKTGKETQVINMMELLGENVMEEEIVEGMEETEHEHEEGREEEHAQEETEYDEHVWLSVKSAVKVVEEIQKAITSLDSENAASYEENASAYISKLQALDRKYEETVKASKHTMVLFGDRFPFRYLTEDYGITYYAAFPGCSAETEASFETIVFLAEKVKENNLPCILTIDGSDKSIAESVKSNAGNSKVKILTLNSLQSVSKEKLEGTAYLSVMEENLEVLKEALN